MASLMPVAKQQYFIPGTTIPLIGGKLYTYVAGTSTPKTTWQDAAGTTPNTNPITLDSTGSALVFWDGAYKIVLKDASDNTIYTVDNYNSDPFGVESFIASLADKAGAALVGFIQAGIGAITRTVQDELRDRISVKQFGAKGDGVTDDTDAVNAAITYAASVGKNVWLPAGVYLLGKLTYLDPVPGNPGMRIWGLLFAQSNVSIFGEGPASVLKAAGGLVGANAAQQGTKGYQMIVHRDPNIAINNFAVRDLAFDGNGANNLVPAPNAYGNQAACHGVMIEKGDRLLVENCYFQNFPGHQVIALSYNTSRVTVRENEFRDCGWLNGTNPNLNDHSTIYIGGTDYVVAGNTFTQSSLMTYGTAIECHGTGRVRGNTVRYYASVGISSALVVNGDHVFSDNTGDNVLCGFSQYCGGAFTLVSKFLGNAVDLSSAAIPNTSPLYKLRNAIYSGQNNIGNNPGDVRTIVRNNTFRMVGVRGWATDAEDLYNAFMISQLVTELVIAGNHIFGFRGALLQLDRQKSAGGVVIERNTVKSCGRKDDYVDNNALVNYSNGADASYGLNLFSLKFVGNSFSDCYFANYLNMSCLAGGVLVCPGTLYVVDDVHDRYLSLFSQTGASDLPNVLSYRFNFTINAAPDTTKPFPSAANAARSAYGEIKLEYPNGVPARFTNIRNSTDWNFRGLLFTDAAPTGARPFGDKQGDSYTVLRAAAAGNSGYYCVASGAGGGLGTWKGTGVIAA